MIQWHIADGVVVGLAILTALIIFIKEIVRKIKVLRACAPAPDPVADHPRRVQELLTIFLAQRKLFQEPAAGIMHALIFWGFCALLLRALTLFGMAFAGFDFHLPLLGLDTWLGRAYSGLKDMANIIVALMVLAALWRRYVMRVSRLRNTGDALFILLMILGLMVSDMVFERILHPAAPFDNLSPTTAAILGHGAFLYHCLAILVFLVYLPTGKHMHILTSMFNVYLRPLRRSGRLTKLDLADEAAETFGVQHIEHVTWKDGLDLYTCTECGRCNDACPAKATAKKLAPREVIIEQRDCLHRESDRLLSPESAPGADKNPKSEPRHDTDKPEELLPEVVSPDEIWACTTCQSCERACPLNIGHVQRIVSMRRSEVLMQSRFPMELKRTFKGLEASSNPWGLGAAARMEWAKDLDIPLWKQTPGAEYLLYLGCAASFDDRARKVSRSLVKLLQNCGVSFAVLGEEETCCGETARRLGEESLGQTLTQANVDLFNKLGVKKIVTPCPHCYNTFKNEYPDFGGNYQVTHHSQLLQDLVAQGKLKPGAKTQRIAIHDSCYMGRINNCFEPPRALLGSMPGVDAAEPDRAKEQGFCCGAGGGLFWTHEKAPRINDERLRQLLETKPDCVATSCPYCLIMLETSAKDAGKTDLPIKDLAELLEN